MKLLTKRRASLVGICMLVGVTVLAFGVTAAQSRRASGTCTPSALTPFISSHQGSARANVDCTGTVSWVYEIRLVNDFGDILKASDGGPLNGSFSPITPPVGCAGMHVHTFIWINVNGVVKSDTSGAVGC